MLEMVVDEFGECCIEILHDLDGKLLLIVEMLVSFVCQRKGIERSDGRDRRVLQVSTVEVYRENNLEVLQEVVEGYLMRTIKYSSDNGLAFLNFIIFYFPHHFILYVVAERVNVIMGIYFGSVL